MDRLPEEILSLIAEQLYYVGSSWDLASLAVVSTSVNTAVTPWLFCDLRCNPKLAINLPALMARHKHKGVDLSRCIRGLVIIKYRETLTRKARCSYEAFLVALVRCLPAVNRLTWQDASAIDGGLLTALNELENMHELDLTYRTSAPNFDLEPPRALRDNLRFTVLRLELQWSCDMPARLEIRHVILHAPALKVLVVKILNDNGQLFFGKGEIFPALENLSLVSYGLGQGPLESQIQEHLQLHQLHGLDLTCCGQASYPRFFDSLMRMTTTMPTQPMALASLRITQSNNRCREVYWSSDLKNFLCSFQGLEVLVLDKVDNGLYCIAEALSHHSKTLRVLKINVTENTPAFVTMQLQKAPIACAALQELSLGVFERSSYGFHCLPGLNDMFQDLISLERLSITTALHRSNAILGHPLVDECFLRTVAFHLRSPNLKRLTVRTDCDCIANDLKGLPPGWLEWEDFHKVAWEVDYKRLPESEEDVSRCCTFRETRREERIRSVSYMCDALNEPSKPPDTFREFKEWKAALETRYSEHLKEERRRKGLENILWRG